MSEMLDIEYRKPYNKSGKKCQWLRKNWHQVPGVYVIKVGDVIKYVGRSDYCVYQAAYRHFAKWCKLRKPNSNYRDVFYSRSTPFIRLALIKEENNFSLEQELIFELQPTDNRNSKGEIFNFRSKRLVPEHCSAYESDYKLINSLYEN